MGTRADFYVGRGETAEWLGSIAFDGYPDGIDGDVLTSPDEPTYRARVTTFLADRDDATFPSMGWPWPWNDSNTTDYAYAFDAGCVWVHDVAWRKASDPEPDDLPAQLEPTAFPQFSKDHMAPAGTDRSGIMVIGSRGLQ